MQQGESLRRVFVDVNRADIVSRDFPVVGHLTGLLHIETGGYFPKADYDAVVKSYNKLGYGARQAYAALAKSGSRHEAGHEASIASLSPAHKEAFVEAGISLRYQNLRVVYDHVHEGGKAYNAKLIEVEGRVVKADADASTISFSAGGNIYAAKRLAHVFAEGHPAIIARTLVSELHMAKDKAEEKAQAIIRHPLRPELARNL